MTSTKTQISTERKIPSRARVSGNRCKIYVNCVWNYENFGGKIISFQKSRQCEEQVLERGYPESLHEFSCYVMSSDLRYLLELALPLGQKCNSHCGPVIIQNQWLV